MQAIHPTGNRTNNYRPIPGAATESNGLIAPDYSNQFSWLAKQAFRVTPSPWVSGAIGAVAGFGGSWAAARTLLPVICTAFPVGSAITVGVCAVLFGYSTYCLGTEKQKYDKILEAEKKSARRLNNLQNLETEEIKELIEQLRLSHAEWEAYTETRHIYTATMNKLIVAKSEKLEEEIARRDRAADISGLNNMEGF